MTDEGAPAHLPAAAEPPEPKRLSSLVDRLRSDGRLLAVEGRPEGTDPALAGIAYDSRKVSPGSVFVAVPGEHVDGHEFVPLAAERGAAALVVERPLPGLAVPQLVVDRSRAALASAAAWWYGDPSRKLGVVGITGTDGKTTTSFLAVAALEAAGISTGLLTTAEVKIGSERYANPEHVTTPQAPELQRMLAAMVAAGNAAAVVETTSHGLALERVAGVAYDVAIFTNLTHEHLELHKTFEAYRDAKLGLFRRLGGAGSTGGEGGPGGSVRQKGLARPWPAAAVVNADDPAGPLFEEVAAQAGAAVITYGLSAAATVRARSMREDASGLLLEVAAPHWQGKIRLSLHGAFNAWNALAVVALGEVLALDPEAVRAGLESVRRVPGRMEWLDLGQPFSVVVDYAHSPASLETVLRQLGPLARAAGGEVIAVFGSAGERDVAKRPMMGRVAGRLCRLVIVADEDPRGEDPESILEQIAAGAEEAGKKRGHDLLCIADRRRAIATAFELARPGDCVLLAGKGHEQSIIMSDGPHPWDERSVALEALGAMGYTGGTAGCDPV